MILFEAYTMEINNATSHIIAMAQQQGWQGWVSLNTSQLKRCKNIYFRFF